MDIVELLAQFPPRIHIEVIVAALPEPAMKVSLARKRQSQLRLRSAFSGAQFSRDTLLEYLDNFGRRAARRLADQQMNVIRHDHISNQRKLEPSAHFPQNLTRNISLARGSEEFPALIAGQVIK